MKVHKPARKNSEEVSLATPILFPLRSAMPRIPLSVLPMIMYSGLADTGDIANILFFKTFPDNDVLGTGRQIYLSVQHRICNLRAGIVISKCYVEAVGGKKPALFGDIYKRFGFHWDCVPS